MNQVLDSELLTDVVPAGTRTTTAGGFDLDRARVASRPVLLATLQDGWTAATVHEVVHVAESFGLPSITLAPAPAGPGLPELDTTARSPHLLIGPPLRPAAAAALAIAGVLPVDSLDLACLLLGYLPAHVSGGTPVYLPADQPEVDGLAPAAARNAVATAFAVCDDVLRLFTHDGDELLLGLGRVHGRVTAVVAPQPVAGPTLTTTSLAKLCDLLELSGRFGLPVTVLGNLPPASADLSLVPLARAVAGLRAPVLCVADDAAGSEVHDLVAAATTAVELTGPGLRSAIAHWLS